MFIPQEIRDQSRYICTWLAPASDPSLDFASFRPIAFFSIRSRLYITLVSFQVHAARV